MQLQLLAKNGNVFCATEFVGLLSIDMYSGEPPTTTSCMDLNIPDAITYGEPLLIDGSVWSGTINALAFDIDSDGPGVFDLMDFNISSGLNESYDLQELEPGTYDITIIDWTDDPTCSLLIEKTLGNHIPITSLNVSSLPDLAIRNETQLQLTAWVFDGTDVFVVVDWGDGTTSPISYDYPSELNIVLFNYIYETEGTFTILVAASNGVSGYTLTQTIPVYERISSLTISGNSLVLTPPGTGTWKIEAGAGQLPLKNIVCVWNMGTSYYNESYDVTMLNSTAPHEITFRYGEDDVGNQTITVNCSNAVSDQSLSMDVEVIWYVPDTPELTVTTRSLYIDTRSTATEATVGCTKGSLLNAPSAISLVFLQLVCIEFNCDHSSTASSARYMSEWEPLGMISDSVVSSMNLCIFIAKILDH